ncbi:MAG: phosphodiester glycosidase family protein [Prochlorococcaceae cyanobacterium]
MLPFFGTAPPLPPPPPPVAAPAATPRSRQPSVPAALLSGSTVRINGMPQRSRWQLQGQAQSPQALWLPLEVLQNQLGVDSRASSDGALKLEWFGEELVVPASAQRSLDDEVSVDARALLVAKGVQIDVRNGELNLTLAAPQVVGVRSSSSANQRRIVLDLAGPALIRREGSSIWLGIHSALGQQSDLRALGLSNRSSDGGLRLSAAPAALQSLFSLGEPARIVIDLAPAAGPEGRAAIDTPSQPQPPRDPRLLALLGRDLQWDQQVRGSVRLNAVRLDPRNPTVQLRPLTRSSGMEGLSSLQQLAAQDDALVAINGGYFNRVRRLPLGALKADGRWHSGPILGRGVVAWAPGSMPRFGRLNLSEWLSDRQGNRLPLVVLNSGYVQRGLSRYNADWGPSYRALSGSESAVALRNNTVISRYSHEQLELGVPLQDGETLIVARGGSELPWGEGEQLSLSSKASSDLAQLPNVIGGGPLLLQGGRIVLNGSQENFSSGFLRQGAPRTVIGSDGRQLWLITLEGTTNAGPSLSETAQLLQQMGLQDALNLDGGSSTGLVMGGVMTVKGRGVAGAVHHGLGLVPAASRSRQSAGRVPPVLAATSGLKP